jgi:Cu(I)/Ag(I) efflux system membrane fusion protein
MKTPAKYALIAFLAAGIFVAGYMANRQPSPAVSSASNKQVLYYRCPMHPQYISDHPGDAPCCGMRLEPVHAGDPTGAETETAKMPGAVEVNASSHQLIGVRTDEVKRAPAAQSLRLSGRVAADEGRLYRIITSEDGWIRSLGRNSSGTFVKRDEVLASVYVPSFQTAQLTLFNSSSDQLTRAEAKMGVRLPPTTINQQVAIDSLRNLGVSDRQIEELKQTRKFATEIYVYSPVSGFVIARNVTPEQRFDKGSELYRIADLSHVWVLSDVFEKDREFLKSGQMATVRYQGRELQARMSDALPQFDPQSRTLKTRFELENLDNILLPDMFVDVELHVNRPAAITVPADAVVDSGRRKTVYIERVSGTFEPRFVETGWRLGDRIQITKGLEPGDRIVTAGNFLIDSESRMKLADESLQVSEKEKVKDPVCGMEIDPDSPNTLKAVHNGQTYYFCMPGCKTKFLANPAKYIGKKPAEAPKMAKDPVCGMEVDPKLPDTLKTGYKGKTYYFCNESCKKSFDAAPEKYTKNGMAPDPQHMMGM